MNKQKNHLPLIGVGPIYVGPTIAVTIASIILTKLKIIPPTVSGFDLIFRIAGIMLIATGIYLWCSAVFMSRIDSKIKTNTLVTDGIYAHVRSPIYSAFLFACSGALLLACNLYLLILPPVYWLYLTIFIKLTEEKWLLNLYGKEFEDYCKRVNRCIPSIWKRKN